jgi:hypothetical protein
MEHGPQFACVTGNVQVPLVTTVNVKEPLKAASVDPAMVPLAPFTMAIAGAMIVATLLDTEILIIGTGAPGTNATDGGPAVGIAMPWPTAKSLVPPLQVNVAEPLVVAQVIVGGVAVGLL